MINSNPHCHLLSSYCMLALVLATLHKYIHVIFFQKLFKDTYHHACFRGAVGGVNPPWKMKHWGSKRSSTYAKIIRSLSLNPSIPDSKAHVPSTVWAIRSYHSWARQPKRPHPVGNAILSTLLSLHEQRWSLLVCLSYFHAFNKYLLNVILFAKQYAGS